MRGCVGMVKRGGFRLVAWSLIGRKPASQQDVWGLLGMMHQLMQVGSGCTPRRLVACCRQAYGADSRLMRAGVPNGQHSGGSV